MGEKRDIEREPQLIKIRWQDSVWFFDVDDTLIDTAGTTLQASEGIQKVFEEYLDKSAAGKVRERFNEIFQLMLAGYRVKQEEDWVKVTGGKEAFDDLVTKVEAVQRSVKEQYGAAKKWSREVFIKLAADQVGVSVTPGIIEKAADAYWIALTERTELLPYVQELFTEIKNHGRPIFLVTSSDARLRMRSDGQFEYDPRYSEAKKRERIAALREKGIDFDAVSIGDPEEKPHPDFFKKGIVTAESTLGLPLDTRNTIMIGDSFAGDLKVPKEELEFGLVVLFQKGKAATEVEDSHQLITGNVDEIAKYLKEE